MDVSLSIIYRSLSKFFSIKTLSIFLLPCMRVPFFNLSKPSTCISSTTNYFFFSYLTSSILAYSGSNISFRLIYSMGGLGGSTSYSSFSTTALPTSFISSYYLILSSNSFIFLLFSRSTSYLSYASFLTGTIYDFVLSLSLSPFFFLIVL